MSQLFRFQAIDDKGVISGALAHFRKGRVNGTIYTDKAMRIPGRNPMKANGRGVLVAYLPEGEEFEVTITRPDGSFVEQFDSTAYTGGAQIISEQPEPQIIEKVVEKIVEVPVEVEKIVYKDHPAASMLKELEAAKAKIDERAPAHEEPPAAIADLFQADRPYAEQAAALWQKYNELTNKIMMKLATDAELKKHQKLQGELDWIKRHAFEGV